MDLEKLREKLEKLAQKSPESMRNEEATKNGLILPALGALGWDVFDPGEVAPEDATGTGNVDFALKIAGEDKIYLEAKKYSEKLYNHVEQVLNYCFHKSAPLAVLTNGHEWWFYLPKENVKLEKRRIFTFDLSKDLQQEALNQFQQLLGKEAVASGEYLEAAQRVFSKQGLEKAWLELLENPTPTLIEHLRKRTHKHLGKLPDATIVKEFIQEYSRKEKAPEETRMKNEQTESEQPSKRILPITEFRKFTGTKPIALLFKGRYEVTDWAPLYLKFLVKALDVAGKTPEILVAYRKSPRAKKAWFSKNPGDLRLAHLIPQSDVYTELHWSSQNIGARMCDVCRLLGINLEEVKVELAK